MELELRARGAFEGHTFIVGFPGMGLVGMIAARHLVEHLNMEYVGEVVSDELPAISSVKQGVVLPPIRMYTSEKGISVLLSDIMIPDDLSRALARAVVKFAKGNGMKRVISLAGVVSPGSEGVFGVASDEKERSFLQRYNIPPVERGMTTGISAALLLEGRAVGFPVSLLLGVLRYKEDYRAAADVVQKLNEMFNLGIEVGDLIEKAERIEREVSQMFAHLEQRKKEARYMPMYG